MLDSERDGTRETELRRDRDEGAIKSPQGGLAKGLPRPKGNRILKKNANLTESTLLADSSLPGLVAAHTYTQAGQGVRGRAVPVGRVARGPLLK